MLTRGQCDYRLLEHPYAECAEDAAQGHVRRDAEEDVDDERFQVARADADQGLRAAARAERHADAEHQAADYVREPGEIGRRIDRLGVIDEAGRLDRRSTEQRHRDREEPHAQPRELAHVHPVGHSTHRAEVCLVADRPEDKSENEGAAGHVRDQRRRITADQRLEKAARRCFALTAALLFGNLVRSSSSVFWAFLRSPMVSWALAMLSIASGAFSLSGQPARSLRCAAIASL